MRIGPLRWIGSLVLALALAAGCGGRSALSVHHVDAGPADPDDAEIPDDAPSEVDARADAPVAIDAPIDAWVSECAAGCDDGFTCTADRCTADRCEHEPRGELCPIDHTCDPSAGCVVRALAHDVGELLEVTLPTGTIRRLGESPEPLIDVAIARDGRVVAVTASVLGRLDVEDRTLEPLGEIEGRLDALAFGADGALYGAGARGLVRIDPASGEETAIAPLPADVAEIGDLAAVGDRLLATATGSDGKELLLELGAEGAVRTVAELGQACVHGLASSAGELYGMTCDGWVVAIDPDTGAVRPLARHSVKFFGAAILPLAREDITIELGHAR